MNKRGQIANQFNWIFAVVAGGIILLFFLFVIGQMKQSADAELAIEVLNNFDAILTGSEVMSNTLNTIESTEMLTFDISCDEDGFSELTLDKSHARVDLTKRFVFTPYQIQGKSIFAYSMPLEKPFLIGNALLLSTKNVLFLFFNPTSNDHLRDLSKTFPQNISLEISPLMKDSYSSFDKIIIVSDQAPLRLNENYEEYGERMLKDMDVNWIQVNMNGHGDVEKAYFYSKSSKDKSFYLEEPKSVDILRNSFLVYLAFSKSPDFYTCNLHKINQKLQIISKIYFNKAKALEEDVHKNFCFSKYAQAQDILHDMMNDDNVLMNEEVMQSLEDVNKGLLLNSCPLIY